MIRRKVWKICLIKRSMSSDLRVRFAPSPTGQLHIGGFRTALYNYLFAKKYGGKFILRLEDTDQARFVPGAAELMEQTLSWGQLVPDESPLKGGAYGPYTQSERLDTYKKAVDILIEKGYAYRCFCTERRLQLLRKEAARNRVTNRYDGHCRNLKNSDIRENLEKGRPYVVRFVLEQDQNVEFEDMVYGLNNHVITEGDPILQKSDGYPTYHLANVVDDHYMKISHVLRGFEWQVSTSKHILLYKAFGWTPPKFGHLPLIINSDGTKLSKRQGDVHLEHYKALGYYSDTLLNFAVTAGGGGFSPDNDKLYDINEMVEDFDEKKLKTNFSELNFDKLDQFNKIVLKSHLKKNSKIILKEMLEHLSATYRQVHVSDQVLLKLIDLERINKVSDLTTNPELQFLWKRPNLDDSNEKANFSEGIHHETLEEIINSIKVNPGDFKEANSAIKKIAKRKKLVYSKVMQYLRILLSGLSQGPPVKDMIELLGSDETMIRLYQGLENIKK